MRVTLVTREMEGLSGAGGLKDVVRGIADALIERGDIVTVFLPRYARQKSGEFLYDIDVPLWNSIEHIRVFGFQLGEIHIRLLDSAYFSSKRAVYTYTKDDCPDSSAIGKGHYDSREMDTLLQATAVLALMEEGVPQDIIHGHDGHTGLLPLFIMKHDSKGFFRNTGVLITIHNAGITYQQILGTVEESAELTGLAPELLSHVTVDNMVNPLMAAGLYGHVNTVSPEYASEILNATDRYSGNLGRSYRENKIHLSGSYNGISIEYWLSKSGLASGKNRQRKSILRQSLCARFQSEDFGAKDILVHGGLPKREFPWVLFHGRFTRQKGLSEILKLDFPAWRPEMRHHFIVYGQGEPEYEQQVIERSIQNKHWTFIQGYDAELTSQLIGASSFLLVPSEWEPCGQIDMIGQLLGSLPIVRYVGGLKKVRNQIDGFVYPSRAFRSLQESLETALNWQYHRERKITRMCVRAKKVILRRRTWKRVLARSYLPLYEKARKSIKHKCKGHALGSHMGAQCC